MSGSRQAQHTFNQQATMAIQKQREQIETLSRAVEELIRLVKLQDAEITLLSTKEKEQKAINDNLTARLHQAVAYNSNFSNAFTDKIADLERKIERIRMIAEPHYR